MPLDLLAGRVAGIRAAGVATAMDDFGTGCHQLSLLREPLWDWVKVWWPVCSLEESELEKAAAICHANAVPMVMEGIEQEADMERVKAFGPRGLQGLAVAPPRIFHSAPDDFKGGVHDENRDPAGDGRMLSRAEREG
jgi:EAL domain-containing protein (putative c-di-GMP-specific phosphodiesterase class I)